MMKFKLRTPYALNLYSQRSAGPPVVLHLAWIVLAADAPIEADGLEVVSLYEQEKLALKVGIGGHVFYALAEDFGLRAQILSGNWQWEHGRSETRAQEYQKQVFQALRAYLRPNLHIAS